MKNVRSINICDTKLTKLMVLGVMFRLKDIKTQLETLSYMYCAVCSLEGKVDISQFFLKPCLELPNIKFAIL